MQVEAAESWGCVGRVLWEVHKTLSGARNLVYTQPMSLRWEMVKDRKAWRAEVHGVTKSQTQATKPHSHYKGNVERWPSSQQSHPLIPAASAASPTLCWQLSCFRCSRHTTPFLPRGFPVPRVRGQWKPIWNAHMHHLLGEALSQWGMGADR